MEFFAMWAEINATNKLLSLMKTVSLPEAARQADLPLQLLETIVMFAAGEELSQALSPLQHLSPKELFPKIKRDVILSQSNREEWL